MIVQRGTLPGDRYVIISNDWARDRRLTLAAKGLMLYLASHREGYELTEAQMVADNANGRDAIRAALRELERFGYLRRVRERTGNLLGAVTYRLGDARSPGIPSIGATCDDATNPQVGPIAWNPVHRSSYKKTKKTSAHASQRLLTWQEWDAIADDHCSDWPGYRSNTEAAS